MFIFVLIFNLTYVYIYVLLGITEGFVFFFYVPHQKDIFGFPKDYVPMRTLVTMHDNLKIIPKKLTTR